MTEKALLKESPETVIANLTVAELQMLAELHRNMQWECSDDDEYEDAAYHKDRFEEITTALKSIR